METQIFLSTFKWYVHTLKCVQGTDKQKEIQAHRKTADIGQEPKKVNLLQSQVPY